jgi:GTPase SAR1 family protein
MGERMESIDFAYSKLEKIIQEVNLYQESILTEEDTRLKVLDRILVEVLGWSYEDIYTEAPSEGGFIDYKITINGRARLIIEAKKDARDFGFAGRPPGKAYKINGPVFSNKNAQEGIQQAIRYCGQKNAELACVTNGREWIVFRGSRLGDGRDSVEGMAFIFTSIEDVLKKFSLFFDLLDYEAVNRYKYKAFFQEAEGVEVRRSGFSKSVRRIESKNLIQTDALYRDLDKVMSSFFQRLSNDNDSEMLSNCFVVTKESRDADSRLARISEDLLGKIRTLETDNGSELNILIERVKKTRKNEFILLIGTKGAGKSTFIERFFRDVIRRELLEGCIIAKINLADNDGSEETLTAWLDQKLLEILEKAIYKGSAPTFDELQGLFFDDYQRWSEGAYKFLYETNKDQFKIKFGEHIENRRENRPNEYIKRLVADIVKNRRKIPCIIFDNADHFPIETQERIFQYARSIYESEICLIIMPITDKTSWQITKEGPLRSFECQSLFLPTPSAETVIRKRVEFLQIRLDQEKAQPGRGYFLDRGINLSLDNLNGFAFAIQNVFLKDTDIANWVNSLSNANIRRALEITKNVITSPHIPVKDLVQSFVDNSSLSVPRNQIKSAFIKGKYDIYPNNIDQSPIRNIFELNEELLSSPILGLRILTLLKDAKLMRPDDPYMPLDQIIEYFNAMQISNQYTISWLKYFLETGLCFGYDPTVIEIYPSGKYEITLSGDLHLSWAKKDWSYIRAMADVSHIHERDVFEKLSSLTNTQWIQKIQIFLKYLIEIDATFCHPIDHQAYVSQNRLIDDLKKVIQDCHNHLRNKESNY